VDQLSANCLRGELRSASLLFIVYCRILASSCVGSTAVYKLVVLQLLHCCNQDQLFGAGKSAQRDAERKANKAESCAASSAGKERRETRPRFKALYQKKQPIVSRNFNEQRQHIQIYIHFYHCIYRGRSEVAEPCQRHGPMDMIAFTWKLE
jgi:hypothetical protein